MKSNPSYTVILDWMLDLGLSSSELLCYATIFGFSQDGESRFTGSRGYLARKMAVKTRDTADASLRSLIEKGLVLKEEHTFNGIKYCAYAVNLDRVPGLQVEAAPAAQPAQAPVPAAPGFDFRKALQNLGAAPDLVDAWMKVRKAKKMVNTEVAYKAIEREILASGRPADECIRLAVEKSWGGFKAEWLENEYARQFGRACNQAPAPVRRGGVDASEDLAARAMEMYNNMN